MTYKTKITSKSTETPRIDTLLYEIEKGNYFIPDFQRFFVWTPERVKSLIDSLLKDVNIPSIMLWKTPLGVPAIREFSEGIKGSETGEVSKTSLFFPETDGDKIYIIDGQQRLTSLYSLYKGASVCSESSTGKDDVIVDFKRFYANVNPKSILPCVIYADEFNDLSFLDKESYFPIYKILQTDGEMDTFAQMSNNNAMISSGMFKVYHSIMGEQLVVQSTINTSLEFAQMFFKKINTAGETLTVYDNACSQLFVFDGNEEEFFGIKHKIDDLYEELKEVDPKGKFSRINILRAVSFCLLGRFSDSYVVKLEKNQVIENWDKIKDSIYRSIVFIKDEFHVKDLKGQINMAILFSKFFFELSSKKDVFNKQKEYLRQCYYICHFRNDKDTCMREKALGNYCHWIVQIAKGNFSDFTSYVEFCNYNQFTDGNVVFFDSQSSIEDCKRYPYISLMMEMEPRSFVTGKVVSLDNKTSNEKLNYHHIFPLANKGEKANNLFNIALLDFESNRDISVKAPSEYIKLENKDFQNGYDLSLSVKESHFLDEIDENILITDNYKKFIEVRSRKIYDFFVKKYKKIA